MTTTTIKMNPVQKRKQKQKQKQKFYHQKKKQRKNKAELDPVEYAQELKRQATKARLEADKMDAILTLEKISLLESKLKKAMSIQEESEIENESVSTSSENNDGDDKKKTNN
eukprot:CAMPEP_0178976528 /NCGR_PEP_ID=MMETSP0789-20121207/23889_1 /TAXON_ID=3005 /ORGANISM="Rhizosolenia setigera, Strain CCMP 1694" /LENGTH=111 /DNA_ID=CAMNT_0020665637 /DNA_START=475 /DNA_END=807 /DNA_ORIENTATION=-